MDDTNSSVPLWKNCPPEILLMIFEFLDVNTLINCMIVNKKWWNISSDIVKRIGWERLSELALSDKGASFRKKSKLNAHDTILNLGLWQEIYLALPQQSFIYDLCEVLNINIYRDNVIVVTHWEVKYFHLESHTLIKTLPISCINFDENEHMYLKVELTFDSNSKIGKFRSLTLYGKETEDSSLDNDKIFLHKSVLYHRLHENCCYFTISEYCIFVATWSNDTWLTQLVARYFGFGTIIDVNVYQDDILALLNWGGMLQVDHGGVKFKMNKKKRTSVVLEIPQYSYDVTLYGNNGAIAAVPCDKPFGLKLYEPEYWVLECPDLRCTLMHGNMILLGYGNGKIDVFNPNKFQDGSTDTVSPHLSLSVTKLARQDLLDPAVRKLEVVEVKGAHVLFIVTSTYVHQVRLGYNLNKI